MNCKNKIKNSVLAGIAAVVFTVVFIVCICAGYNRFVNTELKDISSAYLRGIYGQVNKRFNDFTQKNWNLLEEWQMSAVGSDNSFQTNIADIKSRWGFTDLYFINSSGNCIDTSGKSGYINLGSSMSYLMHNKEKVSADGTVSGNESMIFFAVPTEASSYMGFEYSAVAVGYSKNDIKKFLDENVFTDDFECYIVYPDGKIIMSENGAEEHSNNYIDFLKNAEFSDADYRDVSECIRDGRTNIFQYSINNVRFYMYCQPLGFQNWVLLGNVLQKKVTSAVLNIQKKTVAAVIICFGLLSALILAFIMHINLRKVHKKNLELRFREQLFNILAKSTTEVFIMFTPKDYHVEYVSPNIESVLGVPYEKAKTSLKALDRVLYNEKSDEELKIIDNLKPGKSVVFESGRINMETNEHRWYKETVYRIVADNTDKFIMVLSDITVELQKKQALEEALHTAEAANLSKNIFLSNISYDIRTPMNVIAGISTLLQRDADDPERIRDYAHKITSSSRQLIGRINDILDMSKIESGKTTLNISKINIAEMVEEIGNIVRPQAASRNQSFEITANDIQNENLLGDKLRINQILINILSNAVKYTQEGGSIKMTVCQLPQSSKNYSRFRFEICDNGMGMSQEYIKTIFNPFTRETDRSESRIDGIGLGMAITKNLVDLMGGKISAESEQGRGSKFTVDLDLRIQEKEIDTKFWKRFGLTRMLIVDSNVDVCTNIIAAMEGTDVDIQFAFDGQTAVQMTSIAHSRGQDFNVILIDLEMPKTDGIETAKSICKAVPTDIPIMLLSTNDWSRVRDSALSAGIRGFLTKPFFLSKFRRVIENVKYREHNIEPETEKSILFGMHILAAEDNDLNSEILSELLGMRGATCDIAKNGREALEKFEHSEAGKYDLILMDVKMPVMNGYDAARAIRACEHSLAKTIPIIAMTANAFADDVQDSLESGMDAHVAKPVDMSVLETTVAYVLDEKSKNI